MSRFFCLIILSSTSIKSYRSMGFYLRGDCGPSLYSSVFIPKYS
jgi:hypothetical protein